MTGGVGSSSGRNLIRATWHLQHLSRGQLDAEVASR
jgi:hypothetical protein